MAGSQTELDAELLRGSLELMLLTVLADGPKYGYLIQQRLLETSNGKVKMQAGTLYPLLHKLEAARCVKCRWEDSTGRRRKWYELTAAGRKQLARRVHQWTDYVECLRGVLGSVLEEGARPAEVL
jgi:DNA-binding PadR family transcriptional regulator